MNYRQELTKHFVLFGVFFGSFIFFLCMFLGSDRTTLQQIICGTLCGFDGYYMIRSVFGALGVFLDIMVDEEEGDEEGDEE